MSKHFTHNHNVSMALHQPLAAKNPWTNLPTHNPSTQAPMAKNPWTNLPAPTPSPQQSNAWNPWTNPPTPARNMSHHFTYQPVREAAQNPWTSPPAPISSASPSSSCYSNHAVHSPSFAVSVILYYQPSLRKLWTDAHPPRLPFDGFASILLRICYHRFRICRES